MQSQTAIADSGDLVEQAERLLANVGVPIQPQVVVDINFELAMPDPDFDEIAKLISSDPALTARTLKLANSALFNLPHRVESVKHAIATLGITKLSDLIITGALQEAVVEESDALNEKFWSHSLMVARSAELIARQVLVMSEFASPAYLAGLFHDCAVPLFRQRFADYEDLFVGDLTQGGWSVEEEERRYQTNHCVVGHLVARNWKLPDAVTEAIWFHHDPGLDMHSDPLARMIKAVLILAEYISLSDGTLETDPLSPAEWAERYPEILTELKLSVDEIADLREDALVAFGSAV
ncbi:HDOD domain-containing protein [Endothiovibrio diazotrophicus]